MPKDKKTLKQRLKNGEMVFGTWNNIPSATAVNAITSTGIDFIVIDAEHGPVSIEKAEDLVRAAEVNGVTPIIRVPYCQSYLILRVLDIGAYGVQVPHISTKESAEEVVRYSKYYPLGERGFSPFTRAGKYGIEAEGHAKRSNERIIVVVNVEGVEGIKNLPAITQAKGIDVVFIGPYDLSQSLGIPGEVEHPKVIKTICQSADIVKGRGLACGSFARDERYLDILIDCGVQYITYMVDLALMAKMYKDLYAMFINKKKRRGK